MTKKELRNQISERAKGAATISPTTLQGFLGIGYEKTIKWLKGLDYIDTGAGRKYYVSDVVDRIMERTVST